MTFTPAISVLKSVPQSTQADFAFRVTRLIGDDKLVTAKATLSSSFIFAEQTALGASKLVGTVKDSKGTISTGVDTINLKIYSTAVQNTWEIWNSSTSSAKVADAVLATNGMTITYVTSTGTEAAGSTEDWLIYGQVIVSGVDKNIVTTAGSPGSYTVTTVFTSDAPATLTPVSQPTITVSGTTGDATPLEVTVPATPSVDTDGVGDGIVSIAQNALATPSADSVDLSGTGTGVVATSKYQDATDGDSIQTSG